LELHDCILRLEGFETKSPKLTRYSQNIVTFQGSVPERITAMNRRVQALTALLIMLIAPLTYASADTDTAQPVQNVTLMPLEDRALPYNLAPTLGNVKTDRPKPYKDRCHTQQDLEKSDNPCEYGDLNSKTTVVLFGDSHALSWFPAIERLAIAKHWKLVSETMSSCWPADIPAWNTTTNKLMPNCSLWRTAILNDIVALKPSLIFVTGTRGFATVDKGGKLLLGTARTATWESGMIRTIEKLKKGSPEIVMISDSPISMYEVPQCLRENPTSIEKCATPYAKAVSQSWLAEEKKVAGIEKIIWVDPTPWICSTDPCSPLSGRYQIFVDRGHLTATFAWTLEKPLWGNISALIQS
jgi:hypothetical protein